MALLDPEVLASLLLLFVLYRLNKIWSIGSLILGGLRFWDVPDHAEMQALEREFHKSNKKSNLDKSKQQILANKTAKLLYSKPGKLQLEFGHTFYVNEGDHPLSQCETTSNAQLHDNYTRVALLFAYSTLLYLAVESMVCLRGRSSSSVAVSVIAVSSLLCGHTLMKWVQMLTWQSLDAKMAILSIPIFFAGASALLFAAPDSLIDFGLGESVKLEEEDSRHLTALKILLALLGAVASSVCLLPALRYAKFYHELRDRVSFTIGSLPEEFQRGQKRKLVYSFSRFNMAVWLIFSAICFKPLFIDLLQTTADPTSRWSMDTEFLRRVWLYGVGTSMSLNLLLLMRPFIQWYLDSNPSAAFSSLRYRLQHTHRSDPKRVAAKRKKKRAKSHTQTDVYYMNLNEIVATLKARCQAFKNNVYLMAILFGCPSAMVVLLCLMLKRVGNYDTGACSAVHQVMSTLDIDYLLGQPNTEESPSAMERFLKTLGKSNLWIFESHVQSASIFFLVWWVFVTYVAMVLLGILYWHIEDPETTLGRWRKEWKNTKTIVRKRKVQKTHRKKK